MTPSPPTSLARRRLLLLAVAALFFGPLALAFWGYYGGRWVGGHHTEHGELVQPPVPLDEAGFVAAAGAAAGRLHGHWALVTLAGPHCDAACLASLEATRALRLAVGHDLDRTRRLLIVDGPCCTPPDGVSAADPKLEIVWAHGEAGAAELAHFPGRGPDGGDGRVYLVDPHGNLMMAYPAGAPAKGMLKDLERLLRLSHVG